MKPYLHTNGDLLKRNDQLCKDVKNYYESIVVELYDYETNTQLEQAKQYWKDRLNGANLQFSTIGLPGIVGADSMGIPRVLVPTDIRMALPDLTYPKAPCQRPLIRMIIQHDGEICNCCKDTSGAITLGNVHQQSLKELWFSDHHVQVIRDLAEGHRKKICLVSELSPSLINSSEKSRKKCLHSPPLHSYDLTKTR